MVTTVGEINKRAEGLKGLNFGLSQTISATTGTIRKNASFVDLDGSSNAVAATLAAPRKGQWLVITHSDSTNNATVTLTAGTWDGTNDVATFADADDTLIVFGISATRFVIVENIGAVAFS